jgi:hypothetical protein
MNQINNKHTLLAVNLFEWLNLCARGEIRMSKRRPISVPLNATDREMERVFAAAPFTKLTSSVDLFVLTIDPNWAKTSIKHRSFPTEILTLTLSDVISHHPVAEANFEDFSNKAKTCGVRLDHAIFEPAWMNWTISETVKSSLEAADRLQQHFDVLLSSKTKRHDKYKWEELAQLVLRPNELIRKKPAHVETLISNIRQISDAAAATSESEQFYIACAIEWIDLRLKKDPMKKKETKQLLISALENAKERPLGTPSDQTQAALQHLHEIYPKAFTEEITPMSIAKIVRLQTGSRTKNLKPHTVISEINSLTSDNSTKTLTTFLLATSLGIELTNQLIHSTSHLDVIDMNWDMPNS